MRSRQPFLSKRSVQFRLRKITLGSFVCFMCLHIFAGSKLKLSWTNNLDQIVEFIYSKTRNDDVVMQEFVPNNAKAFIKTEFVEKIEDSFIESGIDISRIAPYELIS